MERKVICHYISIILGVTLSLLVGCNIHQGQIKQPVADNKPTYKDFVSTHTFPYVAPLEKQTYLKHNYSRLSVGFTKHEVNKILGEPDYSQPIYSKITPPGYLGSSWTYFFEKPNPNLTSLKEDKSIQILFDAIDKTHWITSNVEGLNEIGNPRTQDSQ